MTVNATLFIILTLAALAVLALAFGMSSWVARNGEPPIDDREITDGLR